MLQIKSLIRPEKYRFDEYVTTLKFSNYFLDHFLKAQIYFQPRQSLLNAAGRVGEASHAVLASIGEEDDSSRELQEMLLGLAKAVANTTAALVLKAKNIAAACDDQNTQNQVIGAATQCALATSQLVACAKVRGKFFISSTSKLIGQ